MESNVIIEKADTHKSIVRVWMRVNGILFKRVWHKSGNYPSVWDDVEQHFGQIDLQDKQKEKELEEIFKAHLLSNPQLECNSLFPQGDK